MSRYRHNKTTHELEPISGYGSRIATSVDGKTLTVHSSILNIDGYNYGSGDISDAVEMIAPIESTLVASKAYSVGDQFVYNGLLYKVTAAIEEEETIVIGENCELADCVTEQLKAIEDKVSDIEDAGYSKMYTASIVYNSTSGYFPLTVYPKTTGQICCIGRNVSTGAIYSLWYDVSVHAFRIATTLSGSAPSNGQGIVVTYPID